ncbi:MAG: nodulation protein NfeD [Bacteroidetes bacterium]|nr:nodulation protein NfeD [Bacteroidota bacterium]MCL5737978.1 nodulation protein NfeD [Bacteroidota bacterium]
MKAKLALFVLLFAVGSLHASEKVILIRVDGTINPATAEYIVNSISKAEKDHASALVIEMNTPGGLLESTRKIVQGILSSSVPVIVYVYPSGSRAGSAGVFITLSANIAAMAPGTNIGAAHPVGMGVGGDTSSVMSEKIINDAAAFVRAIAQERHRNVAWAQDAVLHSISNSESEALKQGVIDIVSPNLDSLLKEINGRTVKTNTGTVTLKTADAKVEFIPMNWREEFLGIISDPNITYILMMIGIFGIMFELFNPGAILPGVVGAISLILAFYAFQTLPINFAGLALIILAIILFIAEIKIVSHGLLAIGGVISLFLGSLMLIRSPFELVSISLSLIITTVIVAAVFFLWVVGLGLKAQQRKHATGLEAMIGEVGQVVSEIEPGSVGKVGVHGEIWKATADIPLKVGDEVVVESFTNWTLKVKQKK